MRKKIDLKGKILQGLSSEKIYAFSAKISFASTIPLTPTRCRDLRLKQFCLEDIAPAVLIILITHIIIAVRWMLIKILSVVINGQQSHKVIVPDGCYLIANIIRKIDQEIKMLRQLKVRVFIDSNQSTNRYVPRTASTISTIFVISTIIALVRAGSATILYLCMMSCARTLAADSLTGFPFLSLKNLL